MTRKSSLTEAEAIQWAKDSGHFRVGFMGTIETCREPRGYKLGPWRNAEFGEGPQSRVWVRGVRVMTSRMVWAFTFGAIPPRTRIYHKRPDSSLGVNSPFNLYAKPSYLNEPVPITGRFLAEEAVFKVLSALDAAKVWVARFTARV